jgi:hypothetical protein
MGFITNAIKSIKITFYLVERSLTQLDDFLLVHTKIELGHFKIRKIGLMLGQIFRLQLLSVRGTEKERE